MTVGINSQSNVESFSQGVEIVYAQCAYNSGAVVDLGLHTPGCWAANDDVIQWPAITEINNPRPGVVAVVGKGGGNGNVTTDDHWVDGATAIGSDRTAVIPGHTVIKRHVMAMPGQVLMVEA